MYGIKALYFFVGSSPAVSGPHKQKKNGCRVQHKDQFSGKGGDAKAIGTCLRMAGEEAAFLDVHETKCTLRHFCILAACLVWHGEILAVIPVGVTKQGCRYMVVATQESFNAETSASVV